MEQVYDNGYDPHGMGDRYQTRHEHRSDKSGIGSSAREDSGGMSPEMAQYSAQPNVSALLEDESRFNCAGELERILQSRGFIILEN